MSRELTKKERLFVAELPKDWVGSQAVVRAGYRAKDNQRAAEIACQLLKKTQVKQAIEKAMEERLKKAGIHSERVLLEIARVALSDTRKLYNDDGSLKHPKDWPDDVAAAVAGAETFEEFAGRGENRQQIGWTKKVRLFDKVRALEMLGKHLNLYPESTSKVDLDLHTDVSLTNIELSARAIYLIKLALQRKKEMEAKGKTGTSGNEKP
jgi:phage terminase small subunit